jgi:hypothetical protein
MRLPIIETPTRQQLHGDLGQGKRRQRLLSGCVHERLVQQLRGRVSTWTLAPHGRAVTD